MIAIGAYAGAQVIAQVTSLKIGVVAGQAVDMGTFVYPITFTLRDVVHKVAGRQAARTLILTCAGVNLFLAAYLAWTASVESDASWGLGAEYKPCSGPIWRIVLASLVAMVLSELIDTEVYHWFVTRITRRFQWLRVLVSNAVSVPVDNLVFAVGAFAPIGMLGTDGLPVGHGVEHLLGQPVGEGPGVGGLDPAHLRHQGPGTCRTDRARREAASDGSDARTTP